MLLTSGSRGRTALLAAFLFVIALWMVLRSNVIDSAPWPNSGAQSQTAAPPSKPSPPNAPLPPPSKASSLPPTDTSPPPLPKPEHHNVDLTTPSPSPSPTPDAQNPCTGFPDTSDILLIMKTGGTEAYDKLPIHFMTTLQCVKDVILFSDMEMQMGEYHLIDTLDGIAEAVKKDNPDFQLYTRLKEAERLGEDPRPLKDGFSGWNLDKYKFLPMMKKTWEYRQDAKWYFFVEADTGMNWDNIRKFLNMQKPAKEQYIGSPTYLDIEFAHGGTGYIISGAAMKKAVGKHPDIQEKYDSTVQGICCGDRMIAKVLLDENIKLTKAWPMLNGEKPLTVPFTESHWCAPILTMHHLTAQEVSQVWNFEQKRKAQGNYDPILWKDIYDHFVHAELKPTREDWSNLSGDMVYTPDPERDFHGQKWSELTDIERASAESPANCKKLCESDDSCIQWEHHDKECRTGRSIKLGGTKKPEGNAKWISGWRFNKIGEFKAKVGNCTDGPVWKWTTPDGWFQEHPVDETGETALVSIMAHKQARAEAEGRW